MIRRVSDSVEIGYRFYMNIKDGKPVPPGHYYLVINTGRESLNGSEMPVPMVGRIPEMVEAYQAIYTDLLQGTGGDKCVEKCQEIRDSIQNELLNYFPIPELVTYQYKGRQYASFKKSLWSCARTLTADEWRALIARALAREEAKLTAYISGESQNTPKREFIPQSVRNEVWRRDEAKCARCGSRERLEFCHIIPVSLGGSSTARNIELLCETCSGIKGASIV